MSYPTIEKYWKGVEYNDAAHLSILVKRTEEPGLHARCVAVHLLDKDENDDKHNLYVDFIDKNNQRIKLAGIRAANNGRQLRVVIDKPDNEFGTNFPMWSQDTLAIWVDGVPGDIVSGFHTRWGGSMVGGQNYGHISYYVIFQLTNEAAPPPPPPPPPPAPPPVPGEYARGFEDGFQSAKKRVIGALGG